MSEIVQGSLGRSGTVVRMPEMPQTLKFNPFVYNQIDTDARR